MKKKELDWGFIKRCLAFRKQKRDLYKLGYKMHETDWEIHRGGLYRHIIEDVKISVCGKYVYTKISKDPKS